MWNLKDLIKLFAAFFRIGLFTIGGGYTMLPIIEKEVVEKNKWATEEDVMDSYALAQSVPGIIAVNTAAFIGNKVNGILGSMCTVLGVITPSIIIILIISAFFVRFQDIEIVGNAFAGIRIAVLVLLILSIVKMIQKSIKDWFALILAILSFGFVLFASVSPIIVIIVSAIVSVIYYRRQA